MPRTPRRRTLALAFCASLPLLTAVLATPAAAGGGAHPYFNDRGTLTWYHTLSEARRAAKHQGKLIFIEYGRKVCTQCKVLCARVIPHPSVRRRIARVAVGLAANCDRPEAAVRRLFKRHLRKGRLLPLVAFVTPEGRWITGFSGGRSLSQFKRYLAVAERAMGIECQPETPLEPSIQPPVELSLAKQPAPPQRSSPSSEGGRAADDCCPGGECSADHTPHIKFRPPPFIPTPNAQCPPCPEPAPATIAPRGPIAEAPPAGSATFPPPAPLQKSEPSPAPAAGVGSPNGAKRGDLPPPRVRPARPYPGARRSPMTGYGDPDGDAPPAVAHERFASPSQTSRSAALAAAERGEWGEVIRQTRARARTDPDLRALNYRAHAWAHERLAAAVRSLRERRYGDARAAVTEVQRAMQGEPEAIDANRGAEAIELMHDLQHLSEESAVRRTVRKNAYERLRGSRWAPLFSECPQPGRAVVVR